MLVFEVPSSIRATHEYFAAADMDGNPIGGLQFTVPHNCPWTFTANGANVTYVQFQEFVYIVLK